jgi:hypothetical protein
LAALIALKSRTDWRRKQPRLEDVVGADDARKRWLQRKAECLEAGLALGFADDAVHVGQQVGERQPARAVGAIHGVLGAQHAKVVLERPVQRVVERQRNRLGARRAGGHAAPERAGGRGTGTPGRSCADAGGARERRGQRADRKRKLWLITR